MKIIVAALLCGCVSVATSQYLVANVEKAKFRIASLEPVAADTPASTQLLQETEKEVEVPTTRFLTYSALRHPVFSILRKKRDLVAKVRALHGLGSVEADTPASTQLLRPIISEHSIVFPQTRMVYLI